eukprot:gnl/Dysnectes_brevis/1348_a1513_1408.p1 GENE.gnl/Dysnectes_brevis/1348_a1513_1408~~gnl/Dysnectes_brevis/1348_a1513_1408.p1  ORF type:complete len:375 (-),score=69.61 gnl/Dysnectes_brevis/1348_a1513_1408:52-1062(-)
MAAAWTLLCQNQVNSAPVYSSPHAPKQSVLGYIDLLSFMIAASSFFKVHISLLKQKYKEDNPESTITYTPTEEDMVTISRNLKDHFQSQTINAIETHAHAQTPPRQGILKQAVILKPTDTLEQLADHLRRPACHRVFLMSDPSLGTSHTDDRPGRIVGVISQAQFFKFLLTNELTKPRIASRFQDKTAQDMLDAISTISSGSGDQARLAPVGPHTPTYAAILRLGGNGGGLVVMGDDGAAVSTLRRRDLALLARSGDLRPLGRSVLRFLSIRRLELSSTVPSAHCRPGSSLLAMTYRLLAGRFEHLFVTAEVSSPRHWTGVISDGMILRYILNEEL